jgi:dihydrofolate reductase
MATRQIPFDLVLARTLKGGIGKNNSLPWKLPSDLKMFKKITSSGTQGNTVIVGRKTFESFHSKALPNRLNIVISNSQKIPETDSVKQVGTLRGSSAIVSGVAPQW